MANHFGKAIRKINRSLIKSIILLLSIYRLLISPVLGCRCRFLPSCSEYAEEALTKYGILLGGWLALKRIFRCQPFCVGGFDPVPEK